MPSQPPYIPARDLALESWATNFAAIIAASAGTYFLSGSDVTLINSVTAAYSTALTVALNPDTRTKPSVAAKNAAKAAMLGTVRPYAINIHNSLGISNDNKIAVGVNLLNPTRSPIPAPDSNPLLSVIGANQGVHTLRFADMNTPDKRSKPAGIIGMQLFLNIGVAPVTNPAESSFYASVTRQPFAVVFSPTNNGKVATYFARWITRTGLVGPWSPPVSFGIVS
jgi:hypothetical protein